MKKIAVGLLIMAAAFSFGTVKTDAAHWGGAEYHATKVCNRNLGGYVGTAFHNVHGSAIRNIYSDISAAQSAAAASAASSYSASRSYAATPVSDYSPAPAVTYAVATPSYTAVPDPAPSQSYSGWHDSGWHDGGQHHNGGGHH